jgi:hypothetical protein
MFMHACVHALDFSSRLNPVTFFSQSRLAHRCCLLFSVCNMKLVSWMRRIMVLWMRGSLRALGFRGGFCSQLCQGTAAGMCWVPCFLLLFIVYT